MNQLYLDSARLLTRVAPLVLVDNTFALKGGTAINLFVRDMPRRQLREFARRLRQVSQGNQSAEDALDTLENLPPFRDDETVDATWTSVDGVDFVRTLGREASR